VPGCPRGRPRPSSPLSEGWARCRERDLESTLLPSLMKLPLLIHSCCRTPSWSSRSCRRTRSRPRPAADATWAPSFANRVRGASLMPLAPPITTATLPLALIPGPSGMRLHCTRQGWHPRLRVAPVNALGPIPGACAHLFVAPVAADAACSGWTGQFAPGRCT
jgi:hypothetical protein